MRETSNNVITVRGFTKSTVRPGSSKASTSPLRGGRFMRCLAGGTRLLLQPRLAADIALFYQLHHFQALHQLFREPLITYQPTSASFALTAEDC